MIIAAKLVCLVIWMGAATSKLNKHFPFVISTMMSNNPVFRPRFIKRRFFEHFPDDLRPGRPSRCARALLHRDREAGAAGVVLLPRRLADGDRRVRDAVLPLRHPVVDTDGCAAGVERLHDVRRAGAVRRARRGGARRSDEPLPICCSSSSRAPWCWETCSRARSPSCPACATTRATGTPRCGASSRRRTRRSPRHRRDRQHAAAQMEKFYGSKETAQMYLYMGYAFRSFNTHGRAMFTLAHRAMAGQQRGRLRADRRRAASAAPRSAGTSATATCTTSN